MNIAQAVKRLTKRLAAAEVMKFAANPVEAVEPVFGIRAVSSSGLAARRGAGGACDGASFLDDKLLFYAPTPHSKRDNFTIAHEVGHHLVSEDDVVSNWIYDQDDHEAILETICDQVAQQMLLPPTSVDEFLQGRTPRASDVIDLHNGSSASRPVCAIAIAQHLPHFGAVVLIDRETMTVTSSSIHADPERGWPFIYPWPGQTIPLGHQLRNVPDGGHVVRRVSWQGRFGSTEEYFVNAVGTERGLVAVFSAQDLWGAPGLARQPEREWDTRPLLQGTCCGKAFQRRGYPCPTCKKPYCPECGKCPHERNGSGDVSCDVCSLLTPPARIIDGICVDCRS
ncbi:ImmA/IrrE family metallo-endopeptidase [Parafrigoribacterium soli]|uniref:ImmA/IrrE family metallo-endopeptidase n=1 Tax=Parafrigoribacterium soli TaxID=3144663 RepID=UPI0032EBEB79